MSLIVDISTGATYPPDFFERYAAIGEMTLHEAHAELHELGVRVIEVDDTDDASAPMAMAEHLAAALLGLMKRLADGTERMASGLETLAAKVPVLTPLLTVEQVAEYAGVVNGTVYNWVGGGLLKPVAEGVKPLQFEQAVVEEFIKTYRRGRERKRCHGANRSRGSRSTSSGTENC